MSLQLYNLLLWGIAKQVTRKYKYNTHYLMLFILKWVLGKGWVVSTHGGRWRWPTSIFRALLSSRVLPPEFPMFGDWCVDWLLSFASAMSNSKMFFYVLHWNCGGIVMDCGDLYRRFFLYIWLPMMDESRRCFLWGPFTSTFKYHLGNILRTITHYWRWLW